jgi:hypothetical protein
MQKMNEWQSLDDMLKSDYWHSYESSIQENLGYSQSTRDRCSRIYEYAEDGSDGSTHSEHMGDFRDCLNSLRVFDSSDIDLYDFDDLPRYDITDWQYSAIERDIDDCELWHENNGSLDQIIG